MSGTTTYRPKVKVLNKTIETQPYRLDQYAIHCEGNHDLDTPADTFQISLLPSATEQIPSYTSLKLLSFWRKTIKKGDIISIGIEEEDSHLFRIDSIYLTRKMSERSATSVLTIAGRSLASLLIDDDITFAPELATDERSIKLLGSARAQFLGIIRGYMTKSGGNQFVEQNPLSTILWIMASLPSIHIDVPYIDYSADGSVNTVKLPSIEDAEHQKIGGLFTFDLCSYAVDKLYDHELNQFTGKVWNYIMQCIDPMFYEVLIDTVKDERNRPRPCLIVRPKPYERNTDNTARTDRIINPKLSDFTMPRVPQEIQRVNGTILEVSLPQEKINSLPEVNLFWDQYAERATEDKFLTMVTKEQYHTVDPTEDYGGTIGTTTTSVVNFITMHATKDVLWNTELSRYGYMYPLIDTFSVSRYGVRKLEGKSNMLKVANRVATKEETDKFGLDFKGMIYSFEEYVKLRDRIFNWYRYNPIFHEGDDTVLGHDYYRKGDKIYFPGHLSETGAIGMYYRIQAHRWSWDVNENGCQYLSTLKLIRGENREDLQSYRKSVGYDLYDNNSIEPGNPVIKIDKVMIEETPITTGTKINTTDPGNPDVVLKQGTGGLTKKSINILESKFRTDSGLIIKTIVQSAQAYEVNPNIIVGMIHGESYFDPNAVSSSGCLGLGQFSHGTAQLMSNFKGTVLSTTNPSDDGRRNPYKSIMAMGELLHKNNFTGNPVMAIMRYGNTNQTNYFELIANIINDYQPGIFSEENITWAANHYKDIATGDGYISSKVFGSTIQEIKEQKDRPVENKAGRKTTVEKKKADEKKANEQKYNPSKTTEM